MLVPRDRQVLGSYSVLIFVELNVGCEKCGWLEIKTVACKDVDVVLKNGGEKSGIGVGQVCKIPLKSQVMI